MRSTPRPPTRESIVAQNGAHCLHFFTLLKIGGIVARHERAQMDETVGGEDWFKMGCRMDRK